MALGPGETRQFTASGLDQFGDDLTLPELTWSATGGEIDENGYYTAPEGSVMDTVTVSSGEETAECIVTVTNHAPTWGYQPTAEQISATDTAALSVWPTTTPARRT